MLKRAVMGVYHSISETHLQSYVNEISFKFNNRVKDIFNLLIKNMLDINLPLAGNLPCLGELPKAEGY